MPGKCLIVAATPPLWNPRTAAATSWPVRSGSEPSIRPSIPLSPDVGARSATGAKSTVTPTARSSWAAAAVDQLGLLHGDRGVGNPAQLLRTGKIGEAVVQPGDQSVLLVGPDEQRRVRLARRNLRLQGGRHRRDLARRSTRRAVDGPVLAHQDDPAELQVADECAADGIGGAGHDHRSGTLLDGHAGDPRGRSPRCPPRSPGRPGGGVASGGAGGGGGTVGGSTAGDGGGVGCGRSPAPARCSTDGLGAADDVDRGAGGMPTGPARRA